VTPPKLNARNLKNPTKIAEARARFANGGRGPLERWLENQAFGTQRDDQQDDRNGGFGPSRRVALARIFHWSYPTSNFGERIDDLRS
jgi:hypothetical protein